MEEAYEVEALSGEEIINDFVDQIARKLRQDCNLRPSDAYALGYSGEAVVKLYLYGMDTAQVEVHVHIGTPNPEANVQVDAKVEVPHEPDLEAVRKRAELPVPSLETTPDRTQAGSKKRRYSKSLPPVAGGGNEAPLEEDS